MPTYDYRCDGCGHALELFQKITEAPKKKCPKCKKSRLKRQVGGGAGFLFKGSGFYLTDYRSDSYRKGAEAEKSGGGEGKAGESKASESKAGEKGADKPAAKPAGPPDGAKKKDKKSKGKESAA